MEPVEPGGAVRNDFSGTARSVVQAGRIDEVHLHVGRESATPRAALTLRLSEWGMGGAQRRVEVSLEGDGVRRVAVSRFEFELSAQDQERVRWYLEDFLEHPFDPATAVAAGVERRMAAVGAELFDKVFGSDDGRDLWAALRGRLEETRVEIAAEVRDAAELPWELLRDPRTDVPLALRADSFVHIHHQPARPLRLPSPEETELRVLLVICRPAGGRDVPFRSVARHLARLGADARHPFTLDVLRPPTFAKLSEVLHDRARQGRPYHVVHFDGHGIHADLSAAEHRDRAADPLRYGVLSPLRPGPHGYLLFEDPTTEENLQLVDGPALGALLAQTGVPVLVLNACRSGYADPPSAPVRTGDAAPADVHARIRAYGSLAQEIADAGVPGVVSMRYSVYVVTAAQFIAGLYTALLAGQSLGVAVGQGRRGLAAQPNREIAATARPLQDWSVPVVHEAAPLTLFGAGLARPAVRLDPAEPASGDRQALPSPVAGFHGRDETLLALDRACTDHPVVLLHAYAGAGKTATAAEFARWYALTDPSMRQGGRVLFSSFEHFQPLSRLLTMLADALAPTLEAGGINWSALAAEERRRVALQLLEQVPVLWIWDNVEPITGFPADVAPAWPGDVAEELRRFLHDASRTGARIVLTSRRDETAWLGDLPARVLLPAMPMRERIELTRALAARGRHRVRIADWLPLLEFSAGNPLTIMVLVGQALRRDWTSRTKIAEFVERLRAGEAELHDDADQGRSASLTASLNYGFAHTFTGAERARLAILHLFQGCVDTLALELMGHRDNEVALPELRGSRLPEWRRLLGRAAEIGLLTALGERFYQVHPALSWYFARLFRDTFGSAGRSTAEQATYAYAYVVAGMGNRYKNEFDAGRRDAMAALIVGEANLRHARALATRHGWWETLIMSVQALLGLYSFAARNAEWAALVSEIVPEFIDPESDEPLPGRAEFYDLVRSYRIELAARARDWATVERLETTSVRQARDNAAEALSVPPDRLDDVQRHAIRNLVAALKSTGNNLATQHQAGWLEHYREAIELCRRLADPREESSICHNLGNAYLSVPASRDLDEAERWLRRSLELCGDDRHARGGSMRELGWVAYERFHEAAREPGGLDRARPHLAAAATAFHEALELLPENAATDRARVHNQLGNLYDDIGDVPASLAHYQKALAYGERADDRYFAGLVRENIAVTLFDAGRRREARLYAESAVRDFESYGSGALANLEKVRRLLALIGPD